MPPRPSLRRVCLGPAGGSRASFSLALRPRTATTVSTRPTTLPSSASSFTTTCGRSAPSETEPASPKSTSSAQAAAPAAAAADAVFSNLPPESPRYMHIPTPPQSDDTPRPRVRGHLPVPRNVFDVPRKPGAQFVTEPLPPKSDAEAFAARTAPLAQAEARGDAPRSAEEAWQRAVAASRREGLQKGLSGLWTRQQQRTRQEHARAAHKAERNRRAALLTPERRDDVLTRPTVRASTAQTTAVVRDPHRHERQAQAAANTAALAQARRESRRDALMELYQAAGNFIVEEQELRQKVDEIFRPDYFKDEGYNYGSVNAENIWDIAGKPSTVQDMMAGITRTETKLYDSKRTEVDRTTKRQKLVAEALTGGKMPV